MNITDDIKKIIKGDVAADSDTLKKYSRDTSIFERTPALVVYPKDAEDVAAIVSYVHQMREQGNDISIAGRSAGTDMTGGPLTRSIALVFTKYMNHVGEITDHSATTEPGVYYRDFEKETLARVGKILPSYPASRQLCALGGMIANNSGGELTLSYGKTNNYVQSLDVVLSDGNKVQMGPLSFIKLEEKKQLQTLEGKLYRDIHKLIIDNEQVISDARPTVTKNSAGYALWNVINKDQHTFDMAELIVGSQGTLGLVTSATVGLVTLKTNRAMLVIFLNDINDLPEIVHRVLKCKPESFESYDDQTFKLAVRFIPQIIGQLGIVSMIKLGLSFIPEAWMALRGGVPKLILMAEFAEDSKDEAVAAANAARNALADLDIKTHVARSETESAKYWTIRRESFALLRKNLNGLYAAPFIDDLVVHPDDYPKFIPALNQILNEHKLLYTIAGHIGDANFHIIPLMDLGIEENRKEILELTPKVFELVASFKGSITGEHNDGIIRTPYLHLMFGEKMIQLFQQVKDIFDPLSILNPGKKVGGTISDIEHDMIKKS